MVFSEKETLKERKKMNLLSGAFHAPTIILLIFPDTYLLNISFNFSAKAH